MLASANQPMVNWRVRLVVSYSWHKSRNPFGTGFLNHQLYPPNWPLVDWKRSLNENRLRQCSLHAWTKMPKLPQSQHSAIFSSSELTNKVILAPACLPSSISFHVLVLHSSCPPWKAWKYPLMGDFFSPRCAKELCIQGLVSPPSQFFASATAYRYSRPIQINTISSFTVGGSQRMPGESPHRQYFHCSLRPTPLSSLPSTRQQDPAFSQLAGSVAKHLPHLEPMKC